MDHKPGDFIQIGFNKRAQVVWTSIFHILRDGRVEETESMGVWLIEARRYKVFDLHRKDTQYGEPYFYEREEIGSDGL